MIGIILLTAATFASVCIGGVATVVVVDWIRPTIAAKWLESPAAKNEDAAKTVQRAAQTNAMGGGAFALGAYLTLLAVIAYIVASYLGVVS